MKKRYHLMVLGVFGLFGAPFVVPIFRDWSRINCLEQRVDVSTGLARETRYLYWIPFKQTINNTALSGALSNDSPMTRAHRWEPVNTFVNS